MIPQNTFLQLWHLDLMELILIYIYIYKNAYFQEKYKNSATIQIDVLFEHTQYLSSFCTASEHIMK